MTNEEERVLRKNIAREVVESLTPTVDDDYDDEICVIGEVFRMMRKACDEWKNTHKPSEHARFIVRRDKDNNLSLTVEPVIPKKNTKIRRE